MSGNFLNPRGQEAYRRLEENNDELAERVQKLFTEQKTIRRAIEEESD